MDLDIKVLDGSFASQLSIHVGKPIDGDVLWSARYLVTHKEAVIKTNLDFLEAGADVVSTNTYQASINGFMEHLQLTEQESYDAIVNSVSLSRTAIEQYQRKYKTNRKPLIVGCVGPYGASLHDGSEYTGAYALTTSVETMREWHIPRIKALVEGGVDLLAFETIPCKSEAVMLVKLLKTEFPQMKAWLSFSVKQDGKTISFGEDFQETARYCYDLNKEQLVGIGINCMAPRLVESFMSGINEGRTEDPLPLIVYPNSGENYKEGQGWVDKEKCLPIESYVHKWLDIGIKWIGGCCRTHAEDIMKIKIEIEKWRNQNSLIKN